MSRAIEDHRQVTGFRRVAGRFARAALAIGILLLAEAWGLFAIRVITTLTGIYWTPPWWLPTANLVLAALMGLAAIVAVIVHGTGRAVELAANPRPLLRVRPDEVIFVVLCGTPLVALALAQLEESGLEGSFLHRHAWVWAPLVYLALFVASRWGRAQGDVEPVRTSRERLLLMVVSWMRAVGILALVLLGIDLLRLQDVSYSGLSVAAMTRALVELALSFLLVPSLVIAHRRRRRAVARSPVLRRLEEGRLRG